MFIVAGLSLFNCFGTEHVLSLEHLLTPITANDILDVLYMFILPFHLTGSQSGDMGPMLSNMGKLYAIYLSLNVMSNKVI